MGRRGLGVSAQKQAGTREETRVVDWLKDHGWPRARRIAPGGTSDKGDIEWTTGVIVEVKHRRTTTSNAGLGQPGHLELEAWMTELDVEILHADARYGWLIVKRSGTTDVGQYWAYIRLGDLAYMLSGADGLRHSVADAVICMTVDAAHQIMRTSAFLPVPL